VVDGAESTRRYPDIAARIADAGGPDEPTR
jgi:hypothetical protein